MYLLGAIINSALLMHVNILYYETNTTSGKWGTMWKYCSDATITMVLEREIFKLNISMYNYLFAIKNIFYYFSSLWQPQKSVGNGQKDVGSFLPPCKQYTKKKLRTPVQDGDNLIIIIIGGTTLKGSCPPLKRLNSRQFPSVSLHYLIPVDAVFSCTSRATKV